MNRKVKTIVEAMAIKNNMNQLYKRTGERRRAKVKRTSDMQFIIYD